MKLKKDKDKTKDVKKLDRTSKGPGLGNSGKVPLVSSNIVDVAAASPFIRVAFGNYRFALTHGQMVNNSEHADVSIIFNVGGKKEVVHAHEAILSCRRVSGLLVAPSGLLSKSEKKNGQTTCVISDAALVFCNVQILLCVLRYVYAADVSFVKQSDDLAFLVNLLATVIAAGLGDTRLALMLEDRLKELTSKLNVHTLVARCNDLRLERALFNSSHWAYSNWNDFISDKDGCRKVGVELLSKMSATNAKGDAASVACPFAQPSSEEPILADFKSLLATANQNGDVAIECAGKENGIAAHKAVLAAYNDGLRGEIVAAGMLSPSRKKGSSSRTEIQLSSENNQRQLKSAAAVTAFLQFVYYGESKIDPLVAVELIHSLSDYNMTSLEAACETSIQDGYSAVSAFPVLGVTFHPKWVTRPTMGPLRSAVTDFIVQHFGEIDLNTLSALPPELFHALQALQRASASKPSSPPPSGNVTDAPKTRTYTELTPPPPPDLPMKPSRMSTTDYDDEQGGFFEDE